MEAGTGVKLPQPRVPSRAGNYQQPGERCEMGSPPEPARRKQPSDTLISEWSLQNSKRVSSCHFKSPRFRCYVCSSPRKLMWPHFTDEEMGTHRG